MRRLFLLILLVAVGCGSAKPTIPPSATPHVVIATQRPQPTPTFTGAADHVIGPDNAFLNIVVYSDFQCDLCAFIARELAVIRNRYPNDIKVTWRHFPQAADDKALLAAQASEAAAAQDRFWELHDQLFVHQKDWITLTPNQFKDTLNNYAKNIGVADLAAFSQALNKQTYLPLVNKALSEAQALGVQAAPTLVFNGETYEGRLDEFGLDNYTRLRLLEKRWFPSQPDFTIDITKKYTATLVTEKGSIVIELYAQAAPVTVNNFIFLARHGWYDNITFHTVIPGQYAQTGDPSDSGLGTAGYNIIDEHDNGLIFDREGVVAMASERGKSNSGSSQFFITYGPLRPAEDYDGQFTIFGQVTQGMDVLHKLTPRDPGDELRYPDPPPGDKLLTVKIDESK